MAYDAFMSYSHAADGQLAPALQYALHRFTKPWYRVRALHVFRDKTNLPITARLWWTIRTALDTSKWFILLASREAARSLWVGQEVEHWLERHTSERLLILLTEGELVWDAKSGTFDAKRSNALPRALLAAFNEEPLYVDARWVRSEVNLSVRDPRFLEMVAQVAAALHGRPKEELIGDDVREHRRARRIARAAVAALSALTVSLAAAALIAMQQTRIADAQRRVALGRQLAAQSTTILTQLPERVSLAVLLALESTRLHDRIESNEALRAAVSLLPKGVYYAYDGPQTRVRGLAFSPNGVHVAVVHEGAAEVFDVRQRKTLWRFYAGDEPETETETVVDLADDDPGSKASEAESAMTSLAFSPDGLALATGCKDGTVRIWETTTGRELVRAIHGSGVSTVAFDLTGTRLATGTRNGNLLILDSRTGRRIARFAHQEEVRKVAFSPDGRYLAGISTDCAVTLVDTRTIQRVGAWFTGVSGLGLAFSPDATKVATASGDFAFVREVPTGKQLLKVTHLGASDNRNDFVGWVDDAAFSPDSEYLATGARDGTARVWNLATGHEVVRLRHGADVNGVAFAPDGTMLSTASADGTARLWEIPSGQEALRAEHQDGAQVVAFSRDGQRVASAGFRGEVHVWELTKADQISRLPQPSGTGVFALAPDGHTLATVDANGVVRLWTADGRVKRPPVQLPPQSRHDLMFSENGTHVAFAQSRTLFLIEATAETGPSRVVDLREGDFVLGPRYVAAWDRQRQSLRLWETAGGRELAPVDADHVSMLAFDTSGSALATRRSGRDGNSTIAVFALPEWRQMGPPIASTSSLFVLSRGGRRIAVSAVEAGADVFSESRYFVDVWDVERSGRIVRLPREASERPIGFDRDGELLFTVQNREVRIWELPAGRLRARLVHDDVIDMRNFSAGAQLLALTTDRGVVHVWNQSGDQLSKLQVGWSFELSPDGRYLAAAAGDAVTLFRWRTEDLRAEACDRLARNLTVSEWDDYLPGEPYIRTCPNIREGAAPGR